MAKNTHEQLVKEALSKSGVKHEYIALEDEFRLLNEFIKARLEAGKTQEDVAQQMGTTTSVVGRLETGGGKKNHSPTLATLTKYAKALGCVLQVKLIPKKTFKKAA